jgi:hypothetical protein
MGPGAGRESLDDNQQQSTIQPNDPATKDQDDRPCSLEAELADAVCNLSPDRIGWFCDLGIPRVTILAEPLMIGVSFVETWSDGFYEPNDDGELAVIIAEGWPEPPIWDSVDDLIAFKPTDPSRWWRRLGEVQMLGNYNIRPEPVFPTTLYDSPMSWLQAGGTGLCIVDWAINPNTVLMSVGPMEVESSALKEKLERRIQQAALAFFEISLKEVRRAA